MPDTNIEARHSVDSFHRDAFRLVQPTGRGHRSGVDAMLVASALPGGLEGAVADLGAGAGAAGFAVAARCPKTRVTLIENAPEMVECARRSIALPENAALSDRVSLIEADVTLSGDARERAGLLRNAYAATIMNPPFNSASDRATPDALKRAAHVMDDNLFEAWLRTAAAITKPGGFLALIARPASLSLILDALKGRFGGARIVPVHGRAGNPAIRILLRAQKGNRAGLTLEPPLILRDADNQVTERAEALTNGQAALFGD
ncbi:methyltransferase [Nitratireductor rhodophyticola]|uniref:tRNA1(Val) (adenine(37)-N6)-methyltransferase n=1 Tax=Nitratireductor rhodophyticola TaxID=2854036 RepID=UPI0008141247|nr:methyltransferase [Nitratireductor rhodophyticola]WPZ14282.1 methyltransferase [Nitratireductor rhodophyticola]